MAQLRQDFAKFVELGAELIVLGPDGPRAFQRLWEEEQMPFTGLSDVGSKIADLYSQEVNLLKLGRMPALFVVDRDGRVVYSHYGNSMSDIPSNDEVLGVLRGLTQV